MKKLFLCLFASAISISGYSQLASPQDHIGRMQRLMEDATQDYQAQRWDACEERLNQYVALYTELRAVDSTAVQPTWLYVPSAMLGSIAEQQEDWGKAIEFYEYAFIISTQYPNEILAGGVDMNTYIGVWISLKEAYQKHGNNETALDLAKEIVKVCRAHLPDKLTIQLNNLGTAYDDMGLDDDAIASFREAIEIELERPETREDIFTPLENLTALYYSLSRYQDAVDFMDEHREMLNLKVASYPDQVYDLNKVIVNCYYQLDMFDRASKGSVDLVNYAYTKFGKNSVEHADMLGNLAQLNCSYYDARPDEVNILAIAKEQFGECAEIWSNIPKRETLSSYATFLNNYGLLLFELDDFPKAESQFRTALKIHATTDHNYREVITTTVNLAGTLWEQGKSTQAQEQYLHAISLCEAQDLTQSQQYGDLLGKMALLQLVAFDNEQAADEYANRSYEILNNLGNKNLAYVRSLQHLGRIYSEFGDYTKSFDIQHKAIQAKFDLGLTVTPIEWLDLAGAAPYAHEGVVYACKEALSELQNGENDGQKARALDMLGKAYLDMAKYEEAEPHILEAMQIRKKLFGRHSEPYEASLASLASLYSLQHDYNKAEKYALEAQGLNDDLINRGNLVALYYLTNNESKAEQQIPPFYEKSIEEIKSRFLYLSETQRDAYISSNEVAIENLLSLPHHFPNSSVSAQYAYNTSLVMKGLLLNASRDIQRLINESGNEQVRSEYAEVLRLQKELGSARDSLQYQELAFQISLKEKSLQKFVSENSDYTQQVEIRWQDVSEKLFDSDVAIEFIDYYKDVFGDDDTILYGALVLRKEWAAPKMVTLFEKGELDKLIGAGGSKFYSGYVGKQITKLVWEPLTEYINEGDNIYFSPSGALHHLAIESLPTEDGRLTSELYNLHRLSSTKQLCFDRTPSDYNKAVLYGGLTYDLDEKTMVAESRAYTHDALAMRGFEADSLYRDGWAALPGTKREVENISAALAQNDIQSAVFEGQTGNEESFRTLSGQGSQIVHIATHGFFLPLQKAEQQEFFKPNTRTPQSDNSMRRSGLMLSGGNRAWRGEPVPEGVEDGVLTAQEIASLDLRGADLVVLSACETGLGEVTGEGVFGLQRAFKKAGAQTLVMSLWKVSDAATEVMMSEFYANLLAGKSKRESFLAAQAAVRARFPEPYYWAAFIILD